MKEKIKKFGVAPSVQAGLEGSVRTSVRIPAKAVAAIRTAMHGEGLSVRQRSYFISRACRELFACPFFEDLLLEEFCDGNLETITFVLPSSLQQDIRNTVERLSTDEQHIDSSTFVRTAITQALLKNQATIGSAFGND